MTCEIWRTHPDLANALLRHTQGEHTSDLERADLTTYGLTRPDGRLTAVAKSILLEAPGRRNTLARYPRSLTPLTLSSEALDRANSQPTHYRHSPTDPEPLRARQSTRAPP